MNVVIGLFTPPDAAAAIDSLRENGFTSEDLSMISSAANMPDYLEGEPEDAAAAGTAVGAVAGGALGALGTWVAATIPGFEAMLSVGFLNTAAGSVIGGFIGSLFNVRSESQTKIDVHEELAAGKILIIVKTNGQRAETARALMKQGNGEDIEIHDI